MWKLNALPDHSLHWPPLQLRARESEATSDMNIWYLFLKVLVKRSVTKINCLKVTPTALQNNCTPIMVKNIKKHHLMSYRLEAVWNIEKYLSIKWDQPQMVDSERKETPKAGTSAWDQQQCIPVSNAYLTYQRNIQQQPATILDNNILSKIK